MAEAFRFEVLRAEHDRTAFSSVVEPLDQYFREQATQDIRRRVSACYVAINVATSTIAGYYTLAAGGVPLVRCPRNSLRDFPRYESVPVVRLGRLAVDQRYPSEHLATSGGAVGTSLNHDSHFNACSTSTTFDIGRLAYCVRSVSDVE